MDKFLGEHMKGIFSRIIIISFISFCGISIAQSNDDVILGFNSFGFDLYSKINKNQENIIFSPYSLSSLLGILVTGSAGNTRSQLLHVLHIDAIKNFANLNAELDHINSSLITKKSVEQAGNDQAFSVANALWADNNLSYKPDFLKSMQEIKSIHFYQIDFAHASDRAVTQINDWVNTQTNGYITKLLENIDASTQLILTNAIYFKGLWQVPFDIGFTRQEPFNSGNGRLVQVPMMHQSHKFKYAENEFLQMLILDYSKSSLAMAVLLPKTSHNLSQIQHSFNAQLFLQLLKSSYYPEVIVSLPKFKIESTFDSLPESLQALGLTDAFTEKANFSNMARTPLSISQVIQKAIIQVDEKGTVAAAATAVVMTMSAVLNEPKPVNFKADHPFIFIIFDKQSNLILFMGQVNKP